MRRVHRQRERRLARACALAAVLGGAGCGGKGSVTFTIETPSVAALSPFSDPRRDAVALVDELTGAALGQPVSTAAPAGSALAIGDLAVGRYDVRLAISGGAQLLGLARSPGLVVAGGQSESVTLHARKPLALLGAATVLGRGQTLPPPDLLMVLDTTLPPIPELLPATPPPTAAVATATTTDGLLVLAGGAGLLFVATSSDFSVQQKVMLEPAPGAAQAPTVRRIAIAPDDSQVAVLSDQGVSLAPLASLLDGSAASLVTLALPDARAAAFAPDGSAVTVLAGPSWDALSCDKPDPAATWSLAVGANATLVGPTPAPAGATDLAYDASGALLLATPCARDSVVRADGSVALAGTGIARFVASAGGTRLVGIGGALTSTPIAGSPDGAIATTAAVSVGGATSGATPFAVPSEAIAFEAASDGSPVELRLQPTRLDAYDLAASPDGTHLLYAARLRYDAAQLRFFGLQNALGNLVFYCTLDVSRDVYHLSEIDLTTGVVGYDSVRGISESRACSFRCFNCDDLGANCQPNPADNCSVADGYVPNGLSVIMGSN